ncbi:sensor histidine kinase [Saccharopolyspora phatthalungensis]|uniref:histidine kinase n=1 Tax=Saccharopolyspora phatthalungensis TaxID=664693 RepID=A0A840Q1L6_9PSEU|nr:HAMP domain-containing sensor histidine kinase [Saccharopolyspora phatthalungensis]MBB5153850.1 signal transduction histidine kinase [Saccharopolyspora phatthalungensis]
MMARRVRSPDAAMLRRAQLRLGLQTAAAVAAAMLLLAAVTLLVVEHDQHRSQDELLSTATARMDDVSDPPAGVWLVVRSADRVLASPGLPHGFPDEESLRRTARDHLMRSADVVVEGHDYYVRTQPHGADVVQAVLSLRDANAERIRIIQALAAAGGVGLVLAGLAGAWLGRRAVAPLAESLALQRRFVADASHELRTPLTLLSTRAQLIRRRLGRSADPDHIRSDVDVLVADADRLTTILEDLLLAADPRGELPLGPVALTDLAGETVAAASPAAERHGVSVRLEADGPIEVIGFDAGLRRALNALLDNAIRHARSEVRVVLGTDARSTVVEVVDDGPGIDPTILPTLFERFSSAPGGSDRGSRRYGLGLALVSEIAARHGGSVSARRPDAGGTALRLLLPAR